MTDPLPGDGASLVRVSRAHPCPKCSCSHWCSADSRGRFLICMRNKEGASRTIRGGPPGWIHRLDTSRDPSASAFSFRIKATHVTGDWEAIATRLAADLDDQHAAAWAADLGLTDLGIPALRALHCGRFIDSWGKTWMTFPMRDGAGRVIGIKKRSVIGSKKLSFRGGHEGLFVPEGPVSGGVLYVMEGATDTAAALAALGERRVLGRSNCSSRNGHLVSWLHRHPFGTVLLVPDRDKEGQVGARTCASLLCHHHRDVRLAKLPDAKDLREFLKASGPDATRRWLMNAVDTATKLRLRPHFTRGPR